MLDEFSIRERRPVRRTESRTGAGPGEFLGPMDATDTGHSKARDQQKLFEPPRFSALSDRGSSASLAVDARARSASDRRDGKLQPIESGVCGHIRSSHSSHAGLFRLRVGFYEPVSRRGGGQEPALLFSRAGETRGPRSRKISVGARRNDRVIQHHDSRLDADTLLLALPGGVPNVLPWWSGYRSVAHVSRGNDT